MKKFNLDDPRFDISKKVKSCNDKEVNDLDNISVELLNYTPVEKLNEYIPEIGIATWNEDIDNFRETLSDNDRKRLMKLFWEGKFIPTAMASINITVLLRGITTHDVTHLIRHSGLRFAADCTGDKYIDNRPLIVPTFFNYLPKEYHDRFVKISKESYELYDDICNNFGNKVHVQDTRLVLPRTLETYYYITGSLLDFQRMLRQRIDMQFQPKSDNVWALRIYEQIKKVYPDFNIDIFAKNSFYCSLAKDNAVLSSNWYNPRENEKDEYTEKLNTVYGNMEDMYGYDYYENIRDNIIKGLKK